MTPVSKVSLALYAAAAVLMLVGALSHSWWSKSEGDKWGGAGLTEFERCRGDECRTREFDKVIDDDEKIWGTFGNMTFFMTFGAIVGFALAGAGAIRRTPPHKLRKLAISTASVSGLMLVLALLFLATAPKYITRNDVPIGYSMILYDLGCVAGIAAGIMLAREATRTAAAYAGAPQAYAQQPQAYAQQPHAQPPQAQPQAAPSYPCTRCARPIRWIPEHQRYYCDSCQAYL